MTACGWRVPDRIWRELLNGDIARKAERAGRTCLPWLKLPAEFLRRPEFDGLTDAEFGILLRVYLVAADRGNRLPSALSLRRLTGAGRYVPVAKYEALGLLELREPPSRA